ncbi:hypothetical protein [Longimicrobium sp.]|uniref:hypothetical protein n=1 Tax=Longimicrobium sp. TaxID=2029185 RepID=UPI002E37CAD6|nr:hypothetical protein [Longimicrobium sp.]HEX6038671.1 hypothetical protein [Longimicrobium sp.]
MGRSAAGGWRRSATFRGGVIVALLGLALLARSCPAQEAPGPPPSARDTSRLADFLHEASRPLTWAEPLGYTVYDQVRGNPEAWDQDAEGLGRRLAAHAGRTAISLTVRHGTAALLHAPAHPVPCATARGSARVAQAALEPVADRGCDGHVRIALPRITARVASGLAPLVWHYPDYTAETAAKEVASGFVSSALLNVARVLVFGR